MFSVGYFTVPGITVPGGGGGTGTGLNPEQTGLLDDLKAWAYDRGDGTLKEHLDGVSGLASGATMASQSLMAWRTLVVPEKFAQLGPYTQAQSQAEWAKVVASDQLQTGAFASANPDDTIVNEGVLIEYLVNTNINLNAKLDTETFNAYTAVTTPVYVTITQTGSQLPMTLPTKEAYPNAVYSCYPTTGFATDGYSGNEWAMLQISYPTRTTPFEFTVVNRSPTGKKIRLYCSYTAAVGVAKTYAAFRRGNNVNAIWSCSYIEPGQAVRYQYYPASYARFTRLNNSAVEVAVPGFEEFDVDTNESRTQLPVNNT